MKHQRKEFTAAKWKVEHDEDLEVDVTHAFGQSIVVIREKQEGSQ